MTGTPPPPPPHYHHHHPPPPPADPFPSGNEISPFPTMPLGFRAWLEEQVAKTENGGPEKAAAQKMAVEEAATKQPSLPHKTYYSQLMPAERFARLHTPAFIQEWEEALAQLHIRPRISRPRVSETACRCPNRNLGSGASSSSRRRQASSPTPASAKANNNRESRYATLQTWLRSPHGNGPHLNLSNPDDVAAWSRDLDASETEMRRAFRQMECERDQKLEREQREHEEKARQEKETRMSKGQHKKK